MQKPKTFSPKRNTSAKSFNGRKNRDSLYDKNWESYRNYFLRVNPKCYCCGEKSTVVDHERTHKGDKEIFWDVNNYIPLCKKCHDTITALFDRHEPQKHTEKLIWINNMRIEREIESMVRVVPLSAVKSLKNLK